MDLKKISEYKEVSLEINEEIIGIRQHLKILGEEQAECSYEVARLVARELQKDGFDALVYMDKKNVIVNISEQEKLPESLIEWLRSNVVSSTAGYIRHLPGDNAIIILLENVV